MTKKSREWTKRYCPVTEAGQVFLADQKNEKLSGQLGAKDWTNPHGRPFSLWSKISSSSLSKFVVIKKYLNWSKLYHMSGFTMCKIELRSLMHNLIFSTRMLSNTAPLILQIFASLFAFIQPHCIAFASCGRTNCRITLYLHSQFTKVGL